MGGIISNKERLRLYVTKLDLEMQIRNLRDTPLPPLSRGGEKGCVDNEKRNRKFSN
jgi:hypothetical protein